MHYGGEKVSAVCAPDGDHYAALASFCTELPEVAGQDAAVSPRIFKILVDCSGSMLGDSIAQARITLLNIIDGLRPMDRFSLIRFGSHIAKDIAAPVAATAANIARAREMLARMDADLGGTEIFAALQETLQMENDERPADLLLITDGEVWDAAGEESRSRAIIDLANATRQRIFSVGVGSSVSERLVRELAEQTGGACELGNPEEGMAEKIERHFKRIHLPRAQSLEIRWPAEPEWQQQLK
ncbi:VWA domain-containing protein, partial [Thiolapillus sp.]|uniref:VWA domain-containing protein n=1 Tax=Thiolapillus sp. TaxID=2017437 RepID=UPI003AF8A963